MIKKVRLPQFISIHVPKTAGTTFYATLKRIYKSRIFNDPYLSPLNPFYSDILYPLDYFKYDVIHGHFDYLKYIALKRPLIVWVREPTDRLISHYCYWKFGKLRYRGKLPYYFELMHLKNFSIYQFAEIMANSMSLLVGDDPLIYKFIGNTATFAKSLKIFCNRFNLPDVISYHKLNVNKKIPPDFIKNIDRQRLYPFLKKDYNFYYKSLDIIGGY